VIGHDVVERRSTLTNDNITSLVLGKTELVIGTGDGGATCFSIHPFRCGVAGTALVLWRCPELAIARCSFDSEIRYAHFVLGRR
jgi:hypothetical protein